MSRWGVRITNRLKHVMRGRCRFYRQAGGIFGEANCIYRLGDVALGLAGLQRTGSSALQRGAAALPPNG